MLGNPLFFMFMVKANQTGYFASLELAQFSQKDTLPLIPSRWRLCHNVIARSETTEAITSWLKNKEIAALP